MLKALLTCEADIFSMGNPSILVDFSHSTRNAGSAKNRHTAVNCTGDADQIRPQQWKYIESWKFYTRPNSIRFSAVSIMVCLYGRGCRAKHRTGLLSRKGITLL